MAAKTFRNTPVRVSDDENMTCEFTYANVSIFICNSCSGTHLEISLPEIAMSVDFTLTERSAEKLAHYLINPPATDPEEMGSFAEK